MEKERTAALAAMDVVKIARAYIAAAVDEQSGYKALLLDRETMRIVSTLFGRSELADHGVVHIERLDAGGASSDAAAREHKELKVCLRGGVPCSRMQPTVACRLVGRNWRGVTGEQTGSTVGLRVPAEAALAPTAARRAW
jgi:hypothetical protein